MAQILVNLREEAGQSALENGVAGVGGLQSRELGYSSAALEFSFRTHAGPIIHIPTREKLLLAATAAASGAKGIGYCPSGILTATDMQDAMDELQAAVAGAGSLGGVGVAGRLAYWTGVDSLDDVSFLSLSGSKLLFGGDADASIFRVTTGTLGMDGNLEVASNLLAESMTAGLTGIASAGPLIADLSAYFGGTYQYDSSAANNAALATVWGVVSKNNANTRRFRGLHLEPEFNLGGSNASTTFDILSMDSVNTSLTGLQVNLMRLLSGGVERFRLSSSGLLVLAGGGGMDVDGDVQLNDDVWARQFLTVGSDLAQNAPTAGLGAHNFYGLYNRNASGALRHSHVSILAELNAGGSNADQILDVLELGSINTSVTGMEVNLLRMLYGGVQIFKMSGQGMLTLAGPSGGAVALGVNVSNPETSLHISHYGPSGGGQHAALTAQYSIDTPPDPAVLQYRVYFRNNNVVFQVNDGGTVRYKYLDLTGTGITWTHSTTPP